MLYDAEAAESFLLPGGVASPTGMEACQGTETIGRVISGHHSFKCALCGKSYAQELTLAMHSRIVHNGATSTSAPPLYLEDTRCSSTDSSSTVLASLSWKPVGPAVAKAQALLHRSEAWRPSTHFLKSHSATMNAVWGSQVGNYFACGGTACVSVLDLAPAPAIKIRHSFSTDSVVKAIHGTADGRILAYGLKSGEVVIRDMREGGRLMESVPARKGKIFALCLSEREGEREHSCTLSLVVCYDGWVETWVKQDGVPSESWRMMCCREDKAMNSRFLVPILSSALCLARALSLYLCMCLCVLVPHGAWHGCLVSRLSGSTARGSGCWEIGV